ncbi:MAG: tetratricopeptide repeat protein [Pseudomonadales bacterium]|nr:tetratricopeptide repeat protein [Pseudomonadales bacterium]
MRIAGPLLILLFALPALAEVDEAAFSSPRRAIIEAQKFVDDGNSKAATELLTSAAAKFPRDTSIMLALGDQQFELARFGEAASWYHRVLDIKDVEAARTRLREIDEKYEKWASSVNIAVITMQKNTDAGNFETTIDIADKAIAKFPERAILYNAKGEAQYRKGDLDAAEASFRRSLQIDPFNAEARKYIEDIRTTEQAQTSEELAEWISIAKDKVGDFIVTFLALFAAFLVNSLIAPVVLRIKLNSARRAFERGQYDEFTDLIEGLLDEENFAPLRNNFRFMLTHKSFDESREILNKYVNTLERLPTLMRILEREHEKLSEAS